MLSIILILTLIFEQKCASHTSRFSDTSIAQLLFRALAVRKAIFSLPRAVHLRGAFLFHRKVSAFAPVHFRYAAREMQRVLSEARRSDQRLRYSGRSSVFPSGYQGRLLSSAPAPSLHLTNLRTAADPASSLRKKSRPGTGCSTSAEGIVPEPA